MYQCGLGQRPGVPVWSAGGVGPQADAAILEEFKVWIKFGCVARDKRRPGLNIMTSRFVAKWKYVSRVSALGSDSWAWVAVNELSATPAPPLGPHPGGNERFNPGRKPSQTKPNPAFLLLPRSGSRRLWESQPGSHTSKRTTINLHVLFLLSKLLQ